MADISGWMRQQGRVYFDNAATRRDLRVQLRGNKAILLWSFYLFTFVSVAILSYVSITQLDQRPSLAYAQLQLRMYYQTVLAMLAGIICVISPALGATAVVSERQRRSLDLVFTAPVSAKYYLVGKLMSTYRYIWMLLLLSVPVVAVGVVMGGATWLDVAKTYLVISLDALFYSAIALGISAGAPKLTSAVIMSYVVLGTLCILTYPMAAGLGFGRGAPSHMMPVFALLYPFLASETIDTRSTIFGIDLPNLPIFVAMMVPLLYLALLAAGSALSNWHVKETAVLRVIALPVLALLWYLGVANGNMSAPDPYAVGQLFAGCMIPLLIVVPFIGCYTQSDPIKFVFDGRSRLRTVFRATPSGALPYVIAMVVGSVTGYGFGLRSQGVAVDPAVIGSFAVYVLGLFVLTWGVSRFCSRIGTTLASARGLTVVFVSLFLALPALFIGMTSVYGERSEFAAFVPLGPFYVHDSSLALVWGILTMAMGGLCEVAAMKIRASRWRVENVGA